MRHKGILILLFCVLLVPSSVSALDLETDDISISIQIVSGHYEDLNHDGIENDVVTEFIMIIEADDDDDIEDLFSDDDRIFNLRMELILPSGYSFIYSYDNEQFFENVNEYRDDDRRSYDHDEDDDEETIKFEIIVIFWDHALESGDYTFKITLELLDDGDIDEQGETELVFDPPGSTSGPPPHPTFYARR